MITRILGEGQYEVADVHLGMLGKLDAAVQSAAACGDGEECVAGVQALLDAVRDVGIPVPDDVCVPCDLILPDEGTSRRHMRQWRELLADGGLIPTGRGGAP
ncbi:PspA-associated protein PspAA [Streptomyces sp. 7R007]